MSTLDVSGEGLAAPAEPRTLSRGTLVAAAFGVCVAQVALAIPAVLNGLFQKDLGPTSAQLTWISDAFLVPVTLLELTFGVLGDLFGRKRLLVIGALMLAAGQTIGVLTPGPGSSTGTRVLVLWSGQILAGVGAAAIFPTTLAMVAAGTHTARVPGESRSGRAPCPLAGSCRPYSVAGSRATSSAATSTRAGGGPSWWSWCSR